MEFATPEWVDWFNHRRLLEPIGDLPLAETKRATIRRPQRPESHNSLSEIFGTIQVCPKATFPVAAIGTTRVAVGSPNSTERTEVMGIRINYNQRSSMNMALLPGLGGLTFAAYARQLTGGTKAAKVTAGL